MSYTTTESDDAMQSSIHNESPAADISNGCRSRWKGSALKKGPWTTGEDEILIDYVKKHGEGNWNAVQKHTSLSRCGKSCRLRWANHLRPNLKKGAFSQEEEQLIVEMHSKMGNKWARMAEHLPGRTDNEIKNYWNTRIKRRQRAGLPLYPPGMHVEVMQWSEEYTENKLIGTDRGPQDFLQLGNCKTNVLFDGLNFSTSGMLPSASELSDIVGCNILGTCATSSQYESFVQPTLLSPKLLGDFGSRFPGCSSNIKHEYPSPEHYQNSALQRNPRSSSFSPCDVDPLYGNQHSSDMISDSHTVSDGLLTTSKPLFGAVKLELPSFQYPPDSTFDQWKTTTPSSPHSDLLDSVDAYIQSPPPSSLQDPDSFSSCDTGLLDMLLHEAKIKTSAKHSSDHTTKIKSEEYGGDSLKNLAHSEIPSQDGVSSGHVIKSEELSQIYGQKRQQSWRVSSSTSSVPDITRPDVLLASSSSWLDHHHQGFGIVRDSSSMSDALAVLLGDEIGNTYMNMSVGTSSSSCAWTNMPQICQMMELP